MTDGVAGRRARISMLHLRARDPMRDAFKNNPMSQHPARLGLTARIRKSLSASKRTAIAPLVVSIAPVLRRFGIRPDRAEGIAELLHTAWEMAANETALDAEWRSKEALLTFARKPTAEAFAALHPLTRLRIIDRTLALEGASHDERSLAVRLIALEQRVYHPRMAIAAAALAGELDPVRGRPEVPDGVMWGVEALATVWHELGPRWRDSRGKPRAPRVAESRNAGSFTDFCTRLLTIDGAFEKERILGAVRKVAAGWKRRHAAAPRARVPRGVLAR